MEFEFLISLLTRNFMQYVSIQKNLLSYRLGKRYHRRVETDAPAYSILLLVLQVAQELYYQAVHFVRPLLLSPMTTIPN